MMCLPFIYLMDSVTAITSYSVHAEISFSGGKDNRKGKLTFHFNITMES
jgi:hypothetical protein